jgi:HlyD family secretion protein
VEIGHRTGLAAEVVSGLDEGDEVIIYPSAEIEDGLRVTDR